MPLLDQSLLASELKERQMSCRARMRLARTARSNAPVLVTLINAHDQPIRGRCNRLLSFIPDAQLSPIKGRFLGLVH